MFTKKIRYFLLIESIKDIDLKNIKIRNKFSIIYRNNNKIDNLNELSRSIPEIVSIEDKMNNESININTEIKYLFISLVSIFVSESSNLLMKTLRGFACEANSLIENLKSE